MKLQWELRKARQRGGFTLIELLVVIAIIGILASLILPAIVGSKKTAQQVKCLNNIRNLGVAMFKYVGQNGKYPASGYWDVVNTNVRETAVTNPGGHPNERLVDWSPSALVSNPGQYGADTTIDETQNTIGLKYSWVVELLPHMGNDAIADAWDHSDVGANGGGNRGAYMDANPGPGKRGNRDLSNTYIEILACPVDVTSANVSGGLSYVVNGGFAPHWLVTMDFNGSSPTSLRMPDNATPVAGGGWHRENLRKMGLMFLDTTQRGTSANFRHTPQTIRDGESFTIVLSENINAGPSSGWQGGVVTTNWACPLPLNTSFFINTNAVFGGDVTTGANVDGGLGAGLYNFSQSNQRGLDAYPVSATGTNGGINSDVVAANEGQFPYPNSTHPGGVNVVMADGSARFIPDTVAGDVWARLVTPDGGTLRYGIQGQEAYASNYESAPLGWTGGNYQTGNRQVPLDEKSF